MKGFKAQPVAGTLEELMLCKDQQLRLFTVQRNAQLHPVDTVAGDWKEADAASVREFSAAAYYYGKTLRQSLGVPVGLIVTSWAVVPVRHGSTAISSRAIGSRHSLNFIHLGMRLMKKYQQRCPSALYNGMFHPLIGYTHEGCYLVSGEDNCNRYATYADQMQTPGKQLAQGMEAGDFPVLLLSDCTLRL